MATTTTHPAAPMAKGLTVCFLAFALCDAAIFGLSLYNPKQFYSLFPYFVHQDEYSTRLLGYIFFLFGIIRLHGAISMGEKGVYRLAAWSWIIELAIHGCEYAKHEIDSQYKQFYFVVALSASMLLVTTLCYKSILYPDTPPCSCHPVEMFKDFWRKKNGNGAPDAGKKEGETAAPASPKTVKKSN